MKNCLFPNHFRRIGWFMVVLSMFLGIALMVSFYVREDDGSLMPGKAFALVDWSLGSPKWLAIVDTEWTIQIFVLLICMGLLFVGFSREKDEDECIASIRFQSLALSVFVNTAFVILTTLLVYGFIYLNVMYVYAFSLLMLYVSIYYWKMRRFRLESKEE